MEKIYSATFNVSAGNLPTTPVFQFSDSVVPYLVTARSSSTVGGVQINFTDSTGISNSPYFAVAAERDSIFTAIGSLSISSTVSGTSGTYTVTIRVI